MNRFCVVILNWNGAEDTIDCLRSILRSDPAALPIVVDNGSSDDSVARILGAMAAEGIVTMAGVIDDLRGLTENLPTVGVVLVLSGANLGFAGGCNLGLKLAVSAAMDICVFLNNDTIVESLALTGLVQRLERDEQWFATFPLLTVYGTNRIWNCGGDISRLGFRRYNYAGAVRTSLLLPQEIPCSFFTGCCFAVRTKFFIARGGFTERFFFGEEDFELALWMKDHGLGALCLTDCVVHHKVSASMSRAAGARQASKVFVYYLNRFIHMRLRFGMLRWSLWLAVYSPYVVVLLARRRIVPLAELWPYMTHLIRRAACSEGVTHQDFETIMRCRTW
jgi:GT2 family glycosyltransferase